MLSQSERLRQQPEASGESALLGPRKSATRRKRRKNTATADLEPMASIEAFGGVPVFLRRTVSAYEGREVEDLIYNF